MSTHSGPTRRQRKRKGAALRGAGALAGYLLVGLVFLLPLVPHMRTHILADDVFAESEVSDAYICLWSYWWVQKAATGPLDLFDCQWVLPPVGVNPFFHPTVTLPVLLTLPIGRIFGAVAGYNTMIWLMLCFAGFSYFIFLRRAFGVGALPAFLAGIMFGFSPYAIDKAHTHANLVGFCFWGSALAVLVSSYVSHRFTLRRGVLLAVFVWATYWTSFVEFFMLAVVCVVAVVVFEVAHLGRRPTALGRKAAFLVPTLIGAVNLASLAWGPNVGAVEVAHTERFGLFNLFSPPIFSFLGRFWHSVEPEQWGVYLPVSVAVLAFVGYVRSRLASRPAAAAFGRLAALFGAMLGAEIVAAAASLFVLREDLEVLNITHHTRLALLALLVLVGLLGTLGWLLFRRGIFIRSSSAAPMFEAAVHLKCVWVLAFVMLLFTLDFLDLPSGVIRIGTIGRGFRVFTRFLPFALFFLLVLAALGLEWLWGQRTRASVRLLLCALGALAVVEFTPVRMRPARVPWFELPASMPKSLDKSQFVWLPCEKWHRSSLDAYQVALDMPFAYLPQLGHAVTICADDVMRKYPIVYGLTRPYSAGAFLAEARQLHIRYVLFEDIRRYAAFPVRTKVLATDGGSILAELQDWP